MVLVVLVALAQAWLEANIYVITYVISSVFVRDMGSDTKLLSHEIETDDWLLSWIEI